MILEQYYLGCLSQASYLIGDEAAGIAAVIDPRRDVDVYLEEAKKHGLQIHHVLLTHFHADFASGHLELAAKTGATIHLGEAARTEYDSSPLQDGDEIALGNVRVRAIATPGHTPESTSYLCFDGDGDAPHAVFTGDTLFIGDVGRPDLMSSVGASADDLAAQLYASLRTKLLPLPDETIVYPGHGAGSACGKNLSTDTWSTMGAQRASNYALQPMDEAEFVSLVTTGQPPAPAYFAYAAQLNRGQHGLMDDAASRAGRSMSVHEAKGVEGVQILDTRDPETFSAGHMPGSISVGLNGRFASWAGAVLDPARPIALIAEDGRAAETVTRLGRVGFDQVVGHIESGAGVAADGDGRIPRLDPNELEAELASTTPPLVLDVRGPGEVAGGAIHDSLPVPLPELQRRIEEVPKDRRIVVQCAGGYRSIIAASLLLEAGWTDVRDLRGGMDAWLEAGMQVTEDASTCA